MTQSQLQILSVTFSHQLLRLFSQKSSFQILHLGFSQLREHKFRHNFADTLNLLCSCSLEPEDTEHHFLHCQNNLSLRTTLMNDLNNINTAIASLNPNDLLRVIVYGDKSFNQGTNCKILTASIGKTSEQTMPF